MTERKDRPLQQLQDYEAKYRLKYTLCAASNLKKMTNKRKNSNPEF